MKGYRTVDGDYYETGNGPIHPSDSEIPLQPSITYDFDTKGNTWRNTHGSTPHNYPRTAPELEHMEPVSVALTEKKLLSIRDALYLIGIIGSASAVYFGIVTDLKTTKTEVAQVKTMIIEHQTTSGAALRECTDRIRDLELQNARAGKL